MKKNIIIVILIAALFILTEQINAQSNQPIDPVSPGDWTMSLSIGAGANQYRGSGVGPGFQVAVECGMWQLGPGTLTLGGEAGLSYFSHKWADHYRYSYLTTIVAARSAYHYGWKVRGLDTYGGFALGFRILSLHRSFYNNYVDDYSPASFGPHIGAFVGASYFFGPNVGLNAELGYNINFAQIGVIFKLN